MERINFKSTNGFGHQYLPAKKCIVYDNEYNLSKEYNKKQSFFNRYNMLNSKKPNLVTDYDVNIIKGNLANLRMLLIEVTDDCNLACEYCGYGKLYNNYDRRQSKLMDFEKVKVFIDYLYTFWTSPMNVSFNNKMCTHQNTSFLKRCVSCRQSQIVATKTISRCSSM